MIHLKIITLIAGLLVVASGAASSAPEPIAPASPSNHCLVFVGTYTGARSKGVYLFDMNSSTGVLTPKGAVAETPNPTYLDLSPNGRFLYAANEINDFEGKSAGSVCAYAIEAGTGKLTLLNIKSSAGSGPCHVVIDRAGKNALVSNYAGGSLAVLPIESDGRLGDSTAFFQNEGKGLNPERQEKPHTHGMVLDAANHFAFACDLGIDKILIYHFDAAKGRLTPSTPPSVSIKPGSGPRHLVFHPDSRHAYLVNELSSTINGFEYDRRRGSLREIQTISTLPADFNGKNTAAEIAVHPSGKFLYASNRGDNSIVVYAVARSGKLSLVQRQDSLGKIPRYFGIDPTGTFLVAANQDSNNLVVFGINQATGELTATGQNIEAPSPVCVKFLVSRAD